jgi:hypothetical protein
MNEMLKYNPSENRSIITQIIQQISGNSKIVMSIKSVANLVTGFVYFLDNEASMYYSKQIVLRQTSKDFSEIISLLGKGRDSRARASYSYCNRVHFLPSSEAKYKFMYQVVSFFHHDMNNALETFSGFESAIASRFDNPFK